MTTMTAMKTTKIKTKKNHKDLSMIRRALLTLALALCLPTLAQAQDITLSWQGQLSDLAGAPVSADLPMTFRIYDQGNGGQALWSETTNIAVVDGAFVAVLGAETAFPAFDPAARLFVGLTVGDDVEQAPRLVMGGALRAQHARVAAEALDVSGRDIHPGTVSIGNVMVIDAAGRWVGAPIGQVGPAGPVGASGADGAAGPAGAAGARGDVGAPGAAGAMGARGEAGVVGVPGEVGPIGPRGLLGVPGAQGVRGVQGEQGIQGDVGIQGVPGAVGPSDPFPRVLIRPRAEGNPPAGNSTVCLNGAGNIGTECPILKWMGVTYNAYSYDDDRQAMRIIGTVDTTGAVILDVNRNGARYVQAIDIGAGVITFTGQDDRSVTLNYTAPTWILRQP
ncbi:MAG: hypothetical protein ACI9U2_002789 [Bradymonadia bacterium]|jgi:hypothetical protein